MQIVVESLNFCTQKCEAAILGYVIMPNHIHLLVYFKDGKRRIDFMRDFKKFTSVHVRKEVEKYSPQILQNLSYKKGEQVFKVWQDRFDELYIESKKLLEVKLDYIHNNPLQEHWNLANSPEHYRHSSASFYETGIQKDIPVIHYLEFV